MMTLYVAHADEKAWENKTSRQVRQYPPALTTATTRPNRGAKAVPSFAYTQRPVRPGGDA